MIPGGVSYKTLDKIDYLRQVADDRDLPATVRGDAVPPTERIDAGGPVHPGFERVRAAVAASEDADLEALAQGGRHPCTYRAEAASTGHVHG